MGKVSTVLGEIDASALGRTLMHEHIFVLSGAAGGKRPDGWGDEELRVRDAVRRLRALKSAGMDSIVDMTVPGLGRWIPRIRRIAEETDLHVLAATGIYACGDRSTRFQPRDSGGLPDSLQAMTDRFVLDIREGIDGTGIRAAVLKCATDRRGVTPGVETALRAAARAHRATGAPISTHTHAGTRRGLEQLRIFEEEGVDLSRVVIGHSGDTTDLEYLEALMHKGASIGMDRFGIDPVLPFEQRVDTVARLCRKGYAEKMVLSQDAACFIERAPESSWKARAPNWHYLHISNDVLPALEARGVTGAQIRTMLVDNPRRILEKSGT